MSKIDNFLKGSKKIAVIGLGYVGLPLSVLLDKKFKVVGFDIAQNRINELKDGYDKTGEIEKDVLLNGKIHFTSNDEDVSDCDIIIVTVPTPIYDYKVPDLTPVCSATKAVGKIIKKGVIVVYESTVYPGLTEEICVPILEKESGLKWKEDFFVGYSPERVNPADKEHTIDKITKVVAGDTEDTKNLLGEMYGAVINKVHLAPTIKTAEAAKVIENTQRDLNIALVNELAIIFDKLGIDTNAVLEAAGTKWNFLKFHPGLVGGHCIGVDPYYLTYRAEQAGYHPEVILAGRRINDNMGKFIAETTVKKIIDSGKSVRDSKVLIMGFSFKENVNDIRNTKVIDIYKELKTYGVEVSVHDPYAEKKEVFEEYGLDLLDDLKSEAPYDAIIFAVKHKAYLEEFNFERFKALTSGKDNIFIDIKGAYSEKEATGHDFLYWRL